MEDGIVSFLLRFIGSDNFLDINIDFEENDYNICVSERSSISMYRNIAAIPDGAISYINKVMYNKIKIQSRYNASYPNYPFYMYNFGIVNINKINFKVWLQFNEEKFIIYIEDTNHEIKSAMGLINSQYDVSNMICYVNYGIQNCLIYIPFLLAYAFVINKDLLCEFLEYAIEVY